MQERIGDVRRREKVGRLGARRLGKVKGGGIERSLRGRSAANEKLRNAIDDHSDLHIHYLRTY